MNRGGADTTRAGFQWRIALARLLFAGCCSLSSCWPAYALNPEYAVSQYIHTSWRTDAGLQAVRRTKQATDGYLWLATRGGLVRFDGVRFLNFNTATQTGLNSSAMQDLLMDPDGSVWAATLGGGIAHYVGGVIRSYTTRDGLPSNDIGCLYRDSKGNLWVGTRGGGVARMSHDRFEAVLLAIPPGPISAFQEDTRGALWIATFGNGVFRLQNEKLQPLSVEDGLPDSRVASLYRDRSGRIWTAGWKGISWWDGKRFVCEKSANAIVDYAISCMKDRDGNLWIAASSGLFRLNAQGLSKIDRESGLSGDFVSDVFEDDEGDLWISTRAGLDRFRDAQVRIFTRNQGFVAGVGPLVSDPKGAVWALSNKQIARVSGSGISVWQIPKPLGSIHAAMFSVSDSGIWIGSEKGLNVWKAGHLETMPELAGLDIRAVLRAHDGVTWIATANHGLLRWDRSDLTRKSPETVLSDSYIDTLSEDHNAAIWAGSVNGGGLYCISGQNVRHYGLKEGLRSLNIYTTLVDSEGKLWIGSTGGLSWFQNGLIRTVGSKEGMPSDQILALTDDSFGRLWFTSFGGIAAISKTSLLRWSGGRSRELNPAIYGSANALQIWTVGRIFPGAERSADGHVWFSIADGLAAITPPDGRVVKSRPFRVLVEDIKIDQATQRSTAHIRIPPGARSIEVGYTALVLSNPDALRFRYKLEGVDDDWVQAETRRRAYYNTLKPGSYAFRVSAHVGDGAFQEAGPVILEQQPFFYQTRTFIFLLVGSLVSLGFSVHRFRLQMALNRIQAGLEERMSERTRIAQELHDTVVQAISGSVMLVEHAAEKVPDSLPVLKGSLLRAVDGLDLALTESRAALKGLRIALRSGDDLARQLSSAAADVQPPGMNFKLTVLGEPRPIRPVIQYEVFRIVCEAVQNAFKHSGGNSTTVDLEYFGDLVILVRDNGRGISEQALQQSRDGHFGLAGMRERADGIGLTLELSSRPGKGTEVKILLPEWVAFQAESTKSILRLPYLSTFLEFLRDRRGRDRE